MTTRAAAVLFACLAFAAAGASAQGQGQGQGQGGGRPGCAGACGVIQSMAPVTERQEWSPLGSVMAPGGGPAATSSQTTMMQIGPGFTNQGLVVVGAAGGAVYAQKPNEYRRQRWDVTLRMDDGSTRVVSLKYEPLLLQEGDYVRVAGNNLELVGP